MAVAYLALGAFPIACLLAFAFMPKARAASRMLIFGFLLLPLAQRGTIDIPVFHTKLSWVGFWVVFASLVLDFRRWRQLKFRLIDLPAIGYAVVALISSWINGYGPWDAAMQLLNSLSEWTGPYLLGRLYFSDVAGVRKLAIAVVEGGLFYAPLCLYEVRMSPQLHQMLYGFALGAFDQSLRFGGYRPSVFMNHGLMVGFWMAATTVVAWWLWRSRVVTRVWRVPIRWAAVSLLVVTIVCKSTGAIALMFMGIGIRHLPARMRTSVLVAAIVSLAPAYCLLRLNGWTGESLVNMSGDLVNSDRAQSLQFRIANEDRLMERALLKPWFGWGRWGANRVTDEDGKDISVTDGLWIILLGCDGTLGLISIALVLIGPVLALTLLAAPGWWSKPGLAPAGGMAMCLIMYTFDCIPNAMVNPVFATCAGSVAGLVLYVRAAAQVSRRAMRRQAQPHLTPAT